MPRSRRPTVPSDVAGQAALLPATLQPCTFQRVRAQSWPCGLRTERFEAALAP